MARPCEERREVPDRPVGRTRVGAEPGAPPRFWGLLQFALALAAGLLELIHDGGVGEGRDIPQVVLALGDAAEDAAHDLAAPRLRQVGVKMISSGLACGPMAFLTWSLSSLMSSSLPSLSPSRIT